MSESAYRNAAWTFWQRDEESDGQGWGGVGVGGRDRRSAALLMLKSVLELQEGRENMAADEAEPGSMCLFSSVVLISFFF